MVRLFTILSCYKKQMYTAVVSLTPSNGTPAEAILVPGELFDPISQESTCPSDEEMVMPVTAVFNNNDPLTLFYAEDDKDDVDIFRDAITQIAPQIQLYSVETGHALCELLTVFQPDIIFLDLDMPTQNGLECMVEIRSNELYKSLPIVVYSSTSRPSSINTAYEMGADLFFIKPFVFSELLSSLKAILCLDWRTPDKIKEKHLINNQYIAFN